MITREIQGLIKNMQRQQQKTRTDDSTAKFQQTLTENNNHPAKHLQKI